VAIPIESINKKFIVVEADANIRAVRARVEASLNYWTYIVVRLSPDEYAILRLSEIINLLRESPEIRESIWYVPISRILGSSFATKALDQKTTTRAEANRLVTTAPHKRLVVVRENYVIGVLAIESRSVEAAPDFAWLDRSMGPVAAERMETAEPPAAGAGTLSVPPSSPAAPNPSEVESTDTEQRRWINVELFDHPPNKPIELGGIYTLVFDVDIKLRPESLVTDAPLTYRFGKDDEVVDLTIQLSSTDFEIYTAPQILKVPRTGRSKNRARFDFEPKHEGEGTVNAVFMKDGNFIQLLTVKLNVGGAQPLTSNSLSRPIEAAFTVQPRDLGLVITDTGTAFRLILTGPVYAEATLPITVPQLDHMVQQTRKALQEVVNLEVGPERKRSYQQDVTIPSDVHQRTLRQLAEAGFLLFQDLFCGDACDAQAKLLGEKLIEMAECQQLKIQIVSQQFLLPWGMLYLAREFDPEKIDPERFLGFKHIIEHIPLQPSMQVVDSVMNSKPTLSVSLNVNADIDRQMGVPLIAEQLTYWNGLAQAGGFKVIVRQNAGEIMKALAAPSDPEQIMYFYCHAVSKNLSEAGGPESSCLQFGSESLTLRDLKLRAPAKKPLSGAPLVFINACESAELSPVFYGGFVPYFMAKGARGVIGTECEIPAIFAREWARQFFQSFLAGEPLGNVFLDLRRKFLFQHNNALGLLYAIYCDGDTRVVPGITTSSN
jgi:CHAT domain